LDLGSSLDLGRWPLDFRGAWVQSEIRPLEPGISSLVKVYSQVLKGAAYMKIAKELELHATEELAHALKISKQIDYFGGMPEVWPKEVATSEDPKRMLQFDLENEKETIRQYRQLIGQADAMGEFALSEVLREIIVQEQEHLIDLATALGIQAPEIE